MDIACNPQFCLTKFWKENFYQSHLRSNCLILWGNVSGMQVSWFEFSETKQYFQKSYLIDFIKRSGAFSSFHFSEKIDRKDLFGQISGSILGLSEKLSFRPHLWQGTIYSNSFFFGQTILADRYIHRRVMWVVSIKNSSPSNVEFEFNLYFEFCIFRRVIQVSIFMWTRDICMILFSFSVIFVQIKAFLKKYILKLPFTLQIETILCYQ